MPKHKVLAVTSRGRVTFSKAMKSHHNKLLNDIIILEEINVILPQASDRYSHERQAEVEKKIREIDEEGFKQIKSVIDFIGKSKQTKSSDYRPVQITHPGAQEVLSQFVLMRVLSKRIPMFIREMSLEYLVISFENFLANQIREVFSYRNEILKSEKKLSYEELLACKNKKELLSYIIEKEVNDIMNKNIDDRIDEIRSRFSLDSSFLKKEAFWNDFREAFYRRNILVHNQLYPSSSYMLKMITYLPQDKRLNIEKEYLENAYRVFRLCAKTTEDTLLKKFSKVKKHSRR